MTHIRALLIGLLCLFAFAASALQSVTLAWTKSTDPTVTGYAIYYGVGSRVYTNIVDVGSVTNCTIGNLKEGVTYYFAATAYNILGMESSFSSECVYTVPSTLVPAPPGKIWITRFDAWHPEYFVYERRCVFI